MSALLAGFSDTLTKAEGKTCPTCCRQTYVELCLEKEKEVARKNTSLPAIRGMPVSTVSHCNVCFIPRTSCEEHEYTLGISNNAFYMCRECWVEQIAKGRVQLVKDLDPETYAKVPMIYERSYLPSLDGSLWEVMATQVNTFADKMRESLAKECAKYKQAKKRAREEEEEEEKINNKKQRTKEKVAYFQVLGEENAVVEAYVMRMSDLPGGNVEQTMKELHITDCRQRPIWRKGQVITREEQDADENTKVPACQMTPENFRDLPGDIIHGLLAYKAKHTFKDTKANYSYTPAEDEELVFATAAFHIV